METRKEKTLHDAGIIDHFVQDNHSKSNKGVLRGLHFQTRHPQAKLVRVIAGSVYDVAVDCRKGSPTYGLRYGVILSADNKKQLFIPQGFAHGFLTLEDNTEFLYKVSDYRDQEGESGLMRDDPTLNIDRQKKIDLYKITQVQLSKKDTNHLPFDTLPDYFRYHT